MLQLPRARIGRDVVAAIRHAEAGRHAIYSDEKVIREAALALVDATNDWSGMLDGTTSELDAERSLDELLGNLHGAGAKLFLGHAQIESGFRDLRGCPIVLNALTLAVYPNHAPEIFVNGDCELVFIGTTKTAEVMSKYG